MEDIKAVEFHQRITFV